jgi:hypothetical protein
MSSIAVEEETGTFTGTGHGHNGYWGGDFSHATPTDGYLVQWFAWGRSSAATTDHRG